MKTLLHALLLAWLVVRSHARRATEGAAEGAAVDGVEARPSGPPAVLFSLLCALTIMLAITREGSEIMVYLGGFLGQDDKVTIVGDGSAT